MARTHGLSLRFENPQSKINKDIKSKCNKTYISNPITIILINIK